MAIGGKFWGKRGEIWVLLQILAFVLVIWSPAGSRVRLPDPIRWIGALLIISGLVLCSMGAINLGRNITPFPIPVNQGSLVVGGAYRIVRHPIYGGLILWAFGWSLWSGNLSRLLFSLALFGLLDAKSRYEEAHLTRKYDNYDEYRQRVKRLIPWIY